MAEGDGYIYNNFKEQVLNGEFDLTDDTIKVILVTGHSPDIDAHDAYDSTIQADELSDSSYTTGGETLASKAVTQDNTNDRGKFDAADVTFSSLDAGTPSHAIMYDDTHASDLLIAYWEVTTPSNGGDYTLQWHADGIILLT